MATEQEYSPLVQHAESEMRRAGLFDSDADYGGAIAPHVLELVRLFAAGEHSGMSAMLTRDLFHILTAFGTLTPLTSAPEEWLDRIQESGYPLWQNRRNPAAFSEDGGQTWYVLDDQGNRISEASDDDAHWHVGHPRRGG